jgi:transposase InsO family protein
VYCAAAMDAYSRLIVGWSIAGHMRTELVTDALGMAIIRRQPEKRTADSRTILLQRALPVWPSPTLPPGPSGLSFQNSMAQS